MTKQKIWLLVGLSLVLILACAALLPSVQKMVTSFLEILMGQVVLAAVLVQGYDCFDLQMVFNGMPLDDGGSYLCP